MKRGPIIDFFYFNWLMSNRKFAPQSTPFILAPLWQYFLVIFGLSVCFLFGFKELSFVPYFLHSFAFYVSIPAIIVHLGWCYYQYNISVTDKYLWGFQGLILGTFSYILLKKYWNN